MRKIKLSILFVCKVFGLFWIAQYYTRNRLRILCYHGFELADETSFRPKLFIKAARFEQRLATVHRQGFRVLPLDEAVERLYAGTLQENAVVLTVDDGFHSFHSLAVPYLLRYGYPATVYVTTYYVEHASPIFRLVVQYMFWKTRLHELRLEDVAWSDVRVVDLTVAAHVERAIWACIDFGERHCTEVERHAICEQLGALLEVSYKEIVRTQALNLMSPDELRSLADCNVAVDLHTHRHTFPAEDETAAQREIADNRAALARWLPGKKQHFCYPSGHWDERQWSWLDAMQVKSAATCALGLNDRNTPRYALRRILDGENIHQLEFEAALSGFADALRSVRARMEHVPRRLRRGSAPSGDAPDT